MTQPKEYKRGYLYFLECKIDLSLKPMISRKETAFWVKKAISDICKKGEKFAFLDVFSGSGCIGIAVLKNCSKWAKMGIFSDIDKRCAKQAKINLKLNRITPQKYCVIRSDIFKNIKGKLAPYRAVGAGSGFDYIFANPPYIPLKNKHLVQKSVLDYEPHLALFGGEEGLFYIKRFLKDARKYLKKGGKIYLEFDHLRKKETEELLKQLKYKSFKFHKDQFKKWRWVCIEN